MAFVFGTSPDYQAFADILRRVAIGTSLQSITAVATGGTGYVVGDILTVSGGTSVIAAQIEVLAVDGGGAITKARIRNAGLYTATPANDASVTGGAGSGATFTLSWGTNGWTSLRAVNCANALQSATVATGGTGYAVSDVLTVSGGTFSSPATVRVATVGGGGAVTSVEVVNQGDYTTAPTNPASTTGGGGTGCTLNLTFGTGEREIILEGSGSGSDEIIVGWKTFFDSNSGARNMILHGFTGYNPAIPYNDQPGRSPGLETVGGSGTDSGGCYVPLSNSTVTWWISVKPRRIVFVAKVGTCYGTGHLGLLNPFATAGEWPYPIFIAGSTNNRFATPSNSTISTSGFMDPVSDNILSAGPGVLRLANGSWSDVYNSSGTTSRVSRSGGTQVFPAGVITDTAGIPSEDRWFGSSLTWNSFIPTSGNPGTQSARLLPTTFSGGNRFIRIPGTLVSQRNIYGEIDGCFWFDAAATGIVPENRLTDGDERFTVFNNGQRADNWARWALRED